MDTETKLAISSEQMLFARATMRDISLMKIMATRTMLLLVAILFPMLFAMSSLKWEPTFHASLPYWIYLLCSVLSVTLVLMVWYRTVKDIEARASAEIDRAKARPAEKK